MNKSQAAVINWRKKYLPFKAKARLGEVEGELTLTEKALLFSPEQGQPVGADVEYIRAVKPESLSLSISYSSVGEIKSLEFTFPEGDAKDAFRFARRILGIQPSTNVPGFKTLSNEAFQKLVFQLMDLIRVRVQVQDDLHTPEKLLLQELWSQDVFLSWPQILWNEILAYRYYIKVVDNYEKGEIYNDFARNGFEHAKGELERAKTDLNRADLWPPPTFDSFPIE